MLGSEKAMPESRHFPTRFIIITRATTTASPHMLRLSSKVCLVFSLDFVARVTTYLPSPQTQTRLSQLAQETGPTPSRSRPSCLPTTVHLKARSCYHVPVLAPTRCYIRVAKPWTRVAELTRKSDLMMLLLLIPQNLSKRQGLVPLLYPSVSPPPFRGCCEIYKGPRVLPKWRRRLLVLNSYEPGIAQSFSN